MPNRRPPSMSDVAALAAVSHQTVSRVLNDHPSVRPETRERVLAAIAELGYRRNTAARALVTRRSDTIGVITSASDLFGPISTLIAVEHAAREHGLYVSVASVADFSAEAMRTALEHFMSQGVDGVVVIAAGDHAIEAARSFAAPVPVVAVGAIDLPEGPVHPVAVDHYGGARAATRHLLDLGHTRIGHLAGPQDWVDGRERLRGWRDELLAAGLTPPEPIRCDWSAECGYRVGQALVADPERPTALFAANDQLALGVVHAWTEAGLRVPADLSVVGFDDIAGAAHFSPPLTTVRQEFDALGRACLRQLRSLLAGEQVRPEAIAPSLVVRASTAPPTAEGRPGGGL